ncbi:hypothetical protein [Flavobacterium sp.]|uniref:hypothetical protein n=1 Tax=Flavobacterium sp. TaxID=239 RepID=UPI0039E42BFB
MNSFQRFCELRVKTRVFYIFIAVFAVHFAVKWNELDDYSIREGKVIRFDAVRMVERDYSITSRSRTSYYVLRVTPIIEYYSGRDTIVYDEGKRTLLSYFSLNDSTFYKTGEKLKVLERKSDPESVRPFTFFHYWLYTYELIYICLISFVVFGITQYFKK